MLVQGCCIQMDLGHPLSVRDTAVSDVLSSLLLLPYGTNESFPPPHRTVSSVGEGGVFLSVHKVFKEMKMCSSVHMWFSDITSEQQSSWWFVISFCLKRGKNDFQFNILKCWDFRIQKGILWKGEGYSKRKGYYCCFISEAGEVLECLLFSDKDKVQLKYLLSIFTKYVSSHNELKVRVVGFFLQHP